MSPPTGISPSSGSGFEEIDPEDCVSMVQLVIQKCLERESLCNEFYLQLIKQTTDQPEPNGRINTQNWRFMCLICGVVVPRNRVILKYLQTHLRRCGMEPHTEEGKYAQFALQVCAQKVVYAIAVHSLVIFACRLLQKPLKQRTENTHLPIEKYNA